MRRIDYLFFGSIALLVILGLLIIASLSANENPHFYNFYRQLLLVGISVLVLLIFSFIDYRLFKNSPYLIIGIYLFLLLALVLLLFFGKAYGGTKGWFSLGVFNFQPIEFIKIALILVLAKYFSMRNIEIWQSRHLLVSGTFMILPAILTVLQPDLASAMILVAIWLGIIWLSGIKLRQIVALVLIFVLLVLISWNFLLKDYQIDRLTSFLNPQSDIRGSGYNLRQSLIAIGSGGLFGKGLGWGTQTQLRFLPAPKTDFIFASVAEEFGLFGVLLLISCFGVLFWRLYVLALRSTNNFARLFVAGFLIKLIAECSINIAMNLGLLPVAGLPLPLLSFGGSHMISDFIALGIIFNIQRNTSLG